MITTINSAITLPRFSSNRKGLSKRDKLIQEYIALNQLVPTIEATLGVFNPDNLPRRTYIKHHQPWRDWSKTIDDIRIRDYLNPAVDVMSGRVMASKDQRELHSDKTIVTGHGYSSSVTSPITFYSICQILRNNALTYDSRGHGASKKWNRYGLVTGVGFNTPLDMGAVIQNHEKRHPGQTLGVMGYSMSASGLMMYLKRLALESFPESRRKNISQEGLDKLKDLFENRIKTYIFDAPYDELKLMKKEETRKKIREFAKSNLGKLIFGSEKEATERLFKIIGEFNENTSAKYLGTNVPLKDYKPLELVTGSRLAQIPILEVHGKKDTYTLPSAQQNIKESGAFKNVTFVELDADHSAKTLQHPTKPASKKRYLQMVRDPKAYTKAVVAHLIKTGFVDEDYANHPKVKKALEDPNKTVREIIQKENKRKGTAIIKKVAKRRRKRTEKK